VGLCHAWLDATNDPARPSERRYAILVTAAGGSGKVTAYCQALVASIGSPSNNARPTSPPGQVSKSTKTTEAPGQVGKTQTHTTGKPSAKPTHPTDHPSKSS
jgi:hypothetical protein